MTVAPYSTGTPADGGDAANGAISLPSNPSITANNSTLLRLIVVGINTYNGINDNENAPHIVFQFHNVPGTHRMNPYGTTVGGYAGSEMRKYLVPVDGVGGNYLTGLINAGVPESVLWVPSRRVWNGPGSAVAGTIEDALFLPTEREIFGKNEWSHATETVGNQGRFYYYANNPSRLKYNSANSAMLYWDASPYGSNCDFCIVDPVFYHHVYSRTGSTVGVAPAFCVK
ncbi:hypothetical protein FACS1894190_16710 [Spirochaetia bacterium]|nr:hypothetical protein FACS1894190_16710 [Spirochaetia bacterium]